MEKVAIATAKKLGLIANVNPEQKMFKCEIKPHKTSAGKLLKRNQSYTVAKRTLHQMPNLKNIQLKDYSGNLKQKVINERSPYVEIRRARGKRMIFRRITLVWFLRKENQRLNSDRLVRVRHTVKKSPSSKANTYKRGVKKTVYSSIKCRKMKASSKH